MRILILLFVTLIISNLLAIDVTGCGALTTGGYYVLTTNITATTNNCIDIQALGIVFNGNGSTINATTFKTNAFNSNATTEIFNVTLKNYSTGFSGITSNSNISNITFTDSNDNTGNQIIIINSSDTSSLNLRDISIQNTSEQTILFLSTFDRHSNISSSNITNVTLDNGMTASGLSVNIGSLNLVANSFNSIIKGITYRNLNMADGDGTISILGGNDFAFVNNTQVFDIQYYNLSYAALSSNNRIIVIAGASDPTNGVNSVITDSLFDNISISNVTGITGNGIFALVGRGTGTEDITIINSTFRNYTSLNMTVLNANNLAMFITSANNNIQIYNSTLIFPTHTRMDGIARTGLGSAHTFNLINFTIRNTNGINTTIDLNKTFTDGEQISLNFTNINETILQDNATIINASSYLNFTYAFNSSNSFPQGVLLRMYYSDANVRGAEASLRIYNITGNTWLNTTGSGDINTVQNFLSRSNATTGFFGVFSTTNGTINACATISTSGLNSITANFTADQNGCLRISVSDVFLNGSGYTINASTFTLPFTIDVGLTNITIANVSLANFTSALINGTDNLFIHNVTVLDQRAYTSLFVNQTANSTIRFPSYSRLFSYGNGTNITLRYTGGLNITLAMNNSNITFSDISGNTLFSAPSRHEFPTIRLAVNATSGNATFLQIQYLNSYFTDNPALENASRFFWRNGSIWSELSTTASLINNFFQLNPANASVFTILGNPSNCYRQTDIPSIVHNTTTQPNIAIGSSFINMTATVTLNNTCTTGAVNNSIFFWNESETAADCSISTNCAYAVNLTNNTPSNFAYTYRAAITTTQTNSIAQGGFPNANNILYSFETSYVRNITLITALLQYPSDFITGSLYKCEGESAGCSISNFSNWTGSLSVSGAAAGANATRTGDSFLDLFYVLSYSNTEDGGGGGGGASGGTPPPAPPPAEPPPVPPPEPVTEPNPIETITDTINEALQTGSGAGSTVIADEIEDATDGAIALPPDYRPTFRKDNIISAILNEIEGVFALHVFGLLPVGLGLLFLLLPTLVAIFKGKINLGNAPLLALSAPFISLMAVIANVFNFTVLFYTIRFLGV